MKRLPKYAFLTSSVGFAGMKIISLNRPYFIANIYEVNKNRQDLIDEHLEDMAQCRFPSAKVRGYTIFLKMYTSLEPSDSADFGKQMKILQEMADFVLTERIEKKPGQFKGMKED